MNKLNSSNRSFLKSQAHHLDPIIFIGKNGVTPGTIKAVNKALESKELIKIKFHEFKNEKKILLHKITNSASCHLIGTIGHTAILYRQNKDANSQKIILPK